MTTINSKAKRRIASLSPGDLPIGVANVQIGAAVPRRVPRHHDRESSTTLRRHRWLPPLITRVYRCAVVLLLAWVGATPVSAQDLFELEVFPAQTLPAGTTALELHGNGIPGSKSPGGVATTDHPIHASLEVGHGWTEHFETAAFLETAPIARQDGEIFAGGHVRSQYWFSSSPILPFDLSLAVEYQVNRFAFDVNRQMLSIVPILERRDGRMSVLVNPEWSMAIRGPDHESLPKLSASAKVAWQATPGVSAGAEYYWKTEALKHFNPDVDRHHFLLPVMDLHLSPDWELNVGAGHCLSDANERWIVKSIIGYHFH
jgi:hypothetical protein